MKNDALIIGITGNIATGKSVIRRMLENSGSLGIDADVLAHRMIYPDGPAFHEVTNVFGEHILDQEGAISRRNLGQIVFSDPGSLETLEKLVHPWVSSSIQWRVQQSRYPLIVIEAIKLFEAGLDKLCDTVWVSHASFDHQLDRLIQTRNMTEAEARPRIEPQPPQKEKLSQANIVINTEGSFFETWQQIQQALNDTIQVASAPAPQNINNFTDWTLHSARGISSEQLETFWHDHAAEDPSNLFEHLGSHMIVPLYKVNQLTAIIIWENWNFTGAFKHIIPQMALRTTPNIPLMAFEMDARMRQCEVLLLSNDQVRISDYQPENSGFRTNKGEQLGYPAWQQAANRIKTDQDSQLWVKKLMDPFEMKHINTVESNEDL